jgi:hypothetical protein
VILDAARGSIMELAWFVEADTGERIGINPECVVLLRSGADQDLPQEGATGL